jgi:hypothetical protein
MSNVVELFPKGTDLHNVLIEAGTISGPPDHPHLGEFRYFVSVVDADGDPLGVWDGATHKDAVYEARGWELPIVDSVTTAGSGGAA